MEAREGGAEREAAGGAVVTRAELAAKIEDARIAVEFAKKAKGETEAALDAASTRKALAKERLEVAEEALDEASWAESEADEADSMALEALEEAENALEDWENTEPDEDSADE